MNAHRSRPLALARARVRAPSLCGSRAPVARSRSDSFLSSLVIANEMMDAPRGTEKTWRTAAGADESATGLVNLNRHGTKARRWAQTWVCIPLLLCALAAVLFVDLSPVLVHIPITACIVVEVEVRAKFCVAVGALPGAACQMKGLSRAAAFGLCIGAFVVAALPTLGLAYLRGCEFGKSFWLQLVPILQLSELMNAGWRCPRPS